MKLLSNNIVENIELYIKLNMTFVSCDGCLGTIMINNENPNVILQFISVSVEHSVASLILLEWCGWREERMFYVIISLVSRTKDHN